MTNTELTNNTIVRATATMGRRDMTNIERNRFACDISEAIEAHGSIDDTTRLHTAGGTDLVWFAETNHNNAALGIALGRVAEKWSNDAIYLYIVKAVHGCIPENAESLNRFNALLSEWSAA